MGRKVHILIRCNRRKRSRR